MIKGTWGTNPDDPVDAFHEGDRRGLTKREYFANLMMQALLSNPERYKYIAKQMDLGETNQRGASRKNARKAVLLADALIEALNEEAK